MIQITQFWDLLRGKSAPFGCDIWSIHLWLYERLVIGRITKSMSDSSFDYHALGRNFCGGTHATTLTELKASAQLKEPTAQAVFALNRKT